MRSIRVIPCLDIKDGRVVKGVNFVGLRDAGDPIELARFYDREGADELVFLDISASHEARPPVVALAERVAEQVFIPFTVGGGIRSVDTIREVLRAGADKVSLNSAALADPELISRGAEMFGAQCIVVAIDGRARADFPDLPPQPLPHPAQSSGRGKGSGALSRWEVYSHGGRTPTGRDLIEWAQEAEARGAGEILLTSMDGDGTQAGYDIAMIRAVADAVGIPVIASGGAGKPDDLVAAIRDAHADAALVASIVHDGDYRIIDLKRALADAGYPVRIPRELN